jgi:hypothetical protein
MSQRDALNKTALGTASFLEDWLRRIKAEMKKQGVERHAKRTYSASAIKRLISIGAASFTTDDKELMMFERGQIRELLDQMATMAARLRRFEKPVRKARSSDD